MTSKRLPWPCLEDPAGANDQVVDGFHRHFAERGSRWQPPAGIVSDVDPTVRFIGSAISVFKPLLLSGAIPPAGVHIVQPAIRTQNLKVLLDPGARPPWASYFRALGTLAGPGALARTVGDAWQFLRATLGITEDRLVAHAHSTDEDIVAALAAACPAASVELDRLPATAYRHRYGLDRIGGRNCNLAIRQRGGETLDVGNVVVIEGPSGVLGVEFASGVSTLLARIHGLVHPNQAGTIASAMPVSSWRDVRLADAIATTSAMFVAGLRPGARGRRRTMRGYVECVDRLRLQARWSADRVVDVAAEFTRREFGSANGVGDFLAGWLTTDPEATAVATTVRKERDVPGEAHRSGTRPGPEASRRTHLRRRLPSIGNHLDPLHPRHPPLDRLPS